MKDVKTTQFLREILNFAEKLALSKGCKTSGPEWILLSMTSVVSGEPFDDLVTVKKEFQTSEEYALVNSIIMRGSHIDAVRVKAYEAFLSQNKPDDFLTKILMQRISAEVSSKAAAAKKPLVTADIMMQCIVDHATPDMKKYLFGTPSGFQPTAKSAPSASPIVDKSGAKTDDIPIFTEDEPKVESIDELTARIKGYQNYLLETVLGQENAVNTFVTGYFQSELMTKTDSGRQRPKATYLFAGPPGVGKTFLAEKIAEVLKLPYARFDMSEYADKEANMEFCGSDKVYKNGKAGNVTSFVSNNPKCVLLFDEIEKAHSVVIHLFLQLLDAGRLRDNYTDEEVPFKDAVVIFTTNAGHKLYEDSDSLNLSGISRKVIIKALETDVNPQTNAPFFPAAICSRFASGNVVMFNHIEAHTLRNIARREVLRHAANIEQKLKVNSHFDERLFTALLFSEGGASDARTIRGRAESFYNDELFELFRLIGKENSGTTAANIEKIKFTVELPDDDPDVVALFENSSKPEVLFFAGDSVADSVVSDKFTVIKASDVPTAAELFKSHSFSFVVCDITCGAVNDINKCLNVGDFKSRGRDFIRYVTKRYEDLPIYIIQQKDAPYSPEENITFFKEGIRGIVTFDANDANSIVNDIADICDSLHQQHSMLTLARANRLVEFDTAQIIHDGGKTAEIKIFDMRLAVAVDAEDGKNILSNISKPDVKFDQVIGATDAKEELRYFVEYLKNPEKFKATGVKAPRGVLLYGPPGTGKTMLAKAMASESDVTFITAEGNQFVKSYIGAGSQEVHDLFKTARKYAPSIIFVDEIDAIAKERRGASGNDNNEAALTAFLTEMDGFKTNSSKPVFVLAATNFNVESGTDRSLDAALMRRFDRRVFIDLPDKAGRIQYLKMKFAANPAYQLTDEYIDNIALRSTGMSLASLESVLEMALRSSIRKGTFVVDDSVFEDAFETFTHGESKKWSADSLERVARHEAGHAFMYWYNGNVPSYMTIVARGNHGGYMRHNEDEDKNIYTKEEYLALIRTSLGGRAAEMVYYGNEDGISTGPSGDLSNATSRAVNMICSCGMDEEFGLAVVSEHSAYNGELSVEVRNIVNRILDAELKNAIKLISENRAKIDALVNVLMEKNHLNGPEIDEILRSVD